MSAATGFYSTAEDLVRYASAHFFGDERLLTDASKRQQQHGAWSGDPDDPDESSYGLGMSVRSIGARHVVGHSGGFPGHKTQTLIDPKAGLALSVLVNAIDGPAADLGTGILRLLDLGLGTEGPAGDFARYTGRFVNMWRYVDVVRLGDRLVALDPGSANPNDGALDLEPIDDTSFRIVTSSGFLSVGETLRYRFAADGTAESITGIIGMTHRAVDARS
jgi:CubicO group peptidase (beta-lactamase class C family)